MCTMVCIRVTSLRDCLLMVDACVLPKQHADVLQSSMLWRLGEQLEILAGQTPDARFAVLKLSCPALDADACLDDQDIWALASGLKVRDRCQYTSKTSRWSRARTSRTRGAFSCLIIMITMSGICSLVCVMQHKAMRLP